MGHTSVKIRVYGPESGKFRDTDLLVDTGSTYSWIDKQLLSDLGIKPVRKREFKIMNGSLLTREIGEAVIEYGGEKVTTVVVFAEEGDGNVFGVYSMEGLGLEIDPTTRELKKTEAILAL